MFEGTIIGEIIDECKRVYHVTGSMAAMTALTVLSSACGKLYQLTGAGFKPSYPNIFVMIAAERGTGKSVVFDTLAKPIIDLSVEKEQQSAEKRTVIQTHIDTLKEEYKDLLWNLKNSGRKV